ncbi:uncharacterized protein N0V89_003002 [Didymosphaeria variabile]|uniref:Uncharacterized protein n=1 Tax=Didymosphaeria variabile TaxID=1932322 RepID=A0A9W8XSQ3_9PLEO|nr:uncharacterized protein N0V89_003002 [Didymosphaeria variabile]KAJ4358420.1 hypothetical protein N0V89_003002 [Didymosphaeria variabile]
MKLSLFIFFLLSALAIASNVLETETNVSEESTLVARAKATPTKYICGAKNSSCGSKRSKKGSKTRACPVSGGKKSKKTSRSLAPVLTRRTLDSVSNANTYVPTQAIKHKATELDYTYIGHVYAVSKHGSFANKPQVIPLTGLEGCTGIAVVSEKGYWISHFMEVAMDGDQPDHKTMWSHLIKDATHGKAGKYTPPHQLSDIFDADSKPKIYISRPKHNGVKLYTPLINQIMAQIKKGPLAHASEIEFDYKKMMGEAEKNTLGETTARGKMLVEYTNDQQKDSKTQSPQQAMYRVWLEDKDYSNTWPALKTQQGTAGDEEAADKVTKKEYTDHCLVDTSKTIPKDNLDDILAAICNKAQLDGKYFSFLLTDAWDAD